MWIRFGLVAIIVAYMYMPQRSVIKLGDYSFNIQIAKSNCDLAKGLSHRKSLPAGEGMLFKFPRSGRHAMWMKNTWIPLDMLFIENNKVVAIHKAAANSITPISPPVDYSMVLEINAGQADGIRVGDGVVMS